MTRGKLIAFEGLDRAGKSSQCVKLVGRLEEDGHKVRHMRFPDRSTPIGQMIDGYLKGQIEQEDHVIHLLFSANRWEAAASIEKDIDAGVIVVIDRYYYSGCVYSAAKQNPLLDLRWARHPEVGLPCPDLCLFLELSADQAAQRGGWGEERYEKAEMQSRVRNLFGIIRDCPDGINFVTIDAGKDFDHVRGSINEAVDGCIKRVDAQQNPLERVQGW